MTANSSQLEIQNISTFVFLNSTLKVLQKVSLLNNIVNNKKCLYGCNIDHKFISVWELMVYYILLSQHMDTVINVVGECLREWEYNLDER